MNVVAISILSPHHQFVLANVHKKWPLQHVIQPVWTGRTTVAAKCAKLIRSPARTTGQRLKKGFSKWRARQLDRSVANMLDQSPSTPSFDVQRRAIPNTDINSNETIKFVRQLEPDVIITSGCPLLKRQIFGIPRLATINIHWGITPSYRGENTLFWPLYFEDYDKIGVTIHQIDDGIDTGPILAQGFPSLSPSDTEATLLAKSAQLATTLLLDVLATVERTQAVNGRSLQGRGRLFCNRDRSLRHEVAYWLRRKLGRRTLPRTSPRQKIYIDGQISDDDAPSSCTQTEEFIDS